MKELRKEFIGSGEVKDFLFRQICATDQGYFYEVIADGHVHYEVFKRRINTLHECYSYPGAPSFGKWAWTYRDYEKAVKKFESL